MGYPRLPFLILPITRAELPGWGWLYDRLRLGSLPHLRRWEGAPVVSARGKWHGYLMELHLSDWSDRLTFFLGRYVELEVQLAMRLLLRPGDSFIDVGANVGMITLMAARLVGPSGSVRSFEPNPRCAERVRAHAEANRLATVAVYPMALGARDGSLRLDVIDGDAGMGTLAAGDDVAPGRITTSYEVAVRRGDDVLGDLADAPLMIKVDVEGFELEALRGLGRTIAARRPVVLTEYHESSLRRAGASRGQMVDFFAERGYLGFAMATGGRLRRHRLRLTPLSAADLGPTTADALWIHRDDPRRATLAPLIAG